MRKVLVVGAGGHSKVIVDILQQNGQYDVVGFVDSGDRQGYWGIPVIGRDEDLEVLRQERKIPYAFVALGNNVLREKVSRKVSDAGFELINVISSKALVSPRATLGKGVAVMAGAVVQADALIEDGCILNTNSSIDHECRVGAYSHIAPGTAVSGNTVIGTGCFLGTGSRVIDGIHIGNHVTVGAGGTVVGDLEDGCTAVGVPARPMGKRQPG